MPRVSLKDEVIRLQRELAELKGSVAYQTLEQDIETLRDRVEERDAEIEKLHDELLDAESEISRLSRAYSKPVEVLRAVCQAMRLQSGQTINDVAAVLVSVLRGEADDIEMLTNRLMEVLKDGD